MISIEEYCELLNESVKLTIDKKHRLIPIKKRNNKRLKEIDAKIQEFQDTHPKYQIVCKKGYYAGQGIEFQPGDIWGETYIPNQAKLDLKMLSDGWAGPETWEIKII